MKANRIQLDRIKANTMLKQYSNYFANIYHKRLMEVPRYWQFAEDYSVIEKYVDDDDIIIPIPNGMIDDLENYELQERRQEREILYLEHKKSLISNCSKCGKLLEEIYKNGEYFKKCNNCETIKFD